MLVAASVCWYELPFMISHCQRPYGLSTRRALPLAAYQRIRFIKQDSGQRDGIVILRLSPVELSSQACSRIDYVFIGARRCSVSTCLREAIGEESYVVSRAAVARWVSLRPGRVLTLVLYLWRPFWPSAYPDCWELYPERWKLYFAGRDRIRMVEGSIGKSCS